MSEQQENAIFGKGKKMTSAEIKEFFKKKAGSQKGDFNLETERLQKELRDFKDNWFTETITKFFAGKEGKEFLEKHKDDDPDDAYEFLMKHSNITKLYAKAFNRKLDQLRGVVQ
ncbi:hypothetical protein ES703_21655 [subsurface metagenome]|nr:hypothetical protein [bacterium]